MSNLPTFIQKSLALTVHIFTASGLLAAFMSILAIQEKNWPAAMLWLLVCLLIDGIDGTFARLFRVKEVLPEIDGKTIDYVVDFATYAIIPAYFFHESEIVSSEWKLPLTFLILLVSALYYGKEGMVSTDNYFIGFPVLWNMVVFYLLFAVNFSTLINAILIIFFAVLHFIPVKFAYPSRASRLKIPTLLVSIIFLTAVPLTVLYYPTPPIWLIGILHLTLVYYAGLAIWDTFFDN